MSILTDKNILERILRGETLLLKKIKPEKTRRLIKQIEEFREKLNKVRNLEEFEKLKVKIDKYFSEVWQEHSNRIEGIREVVDELKEHKPRRNGKSESIMMSNFCIDALQGASYNLRLDKNIYISTDTLPRRLTKVQDTVKINPGEFGILLTYEYIYVPHNLMAFISLRFRFKQQGLINISGFHVDPGFQGRIIFSVYNAGPIPVTLRYKEQVFSVMFNELTQPAINYYKGIFGGQENIPVGMVTSLSGPSISVIQLNQRVNNLESRARFMILLVAGLFSGIVVTLLAYLLGFVK